MTRREMRTYFENKGYRYSDYDADYIYLHKYEGNLGGWVSEVRLAWNEKTFFVEDGRTGRVKKYIYK